MPLLHGGRGHELDDLADGVDLRVVYKPRAHQTAAALVTVGLATRLACTFAIQNKDRLL